MANTTPLFGTATLALSGGTLVEAVNAVLLMSGGTINVASGNNTYVTAVSGLIDFHIYGNLTGSGSITNVSPENYVWLKGNNSNFSGTFINQSSTTNDLLIFNNNNAGSPNATWVINTKAAYGVGSAGTISLGALSGTNASATLGTVYGADNVAYVIGALNISTTFAGIIQNGGGTTSIANVGTGTLTLSGSNTYTGGTLLAGGTLLLAARVPWEAPDRISFTGGTLAFSGSNTTDYSARFSTASNQTYNINTSGQSVTFATALTSSGGSLTKFGRHADPLCQQHLQRHDHHQHRHAANR